MAALVTLDARTGMCGTYAFSKAACAAGSVRLPSFGRPDPSSPLSRRPEALGLRVESGGFLPQRSRSRLQQADGLSRPSGRRRLDLSARSRSANSVLISALRWVLSWRLPWAANTEVKNVSALPQMLSTQRVYVSTRPSEMVPSSSVTGRQRPASSSVCRNASVRRRPLTADDDLRAVAAAIVRPGQDPSGSPADGACS